MLGTGGGLLRAAVAEDGARSASVAVVDFGKGLKRASLKQEQAGAVFVFINFLEYAWYRFNIMLEPEYHTIIKANFLTKLFWLEI